MEKNLVIGIEGLVGAGKTSICKELLNYIPNSIVLHAGNIYNILGGVFMSKEKKNKQSKKKSSTTTDDE